MSSFHERKEQRKKYYENYIVGWKQRECTACNGSGYYDHNGSPFCGACDGTGKERYKPIKGD
jgi:DnaJ-class molecular chaperone